MATEEVTSTENGTEKPSDLEKKIIRQIEYYFGDQNLVRDKFLKEKIALDDGWVTLECLTTFNRLKALSTDFAVIMAALRKSHSGLLEIDSDGNKLRRCKEKPIPDSDDPKLRDLSKAKTVYVKGFPEDNSIDEVEAFFADKGKVVFLKMRRRADKSFKGSVFAEFETADMAKQFLEMKELKIGETELIKMHRDDYYKLKEEERKVIKKQEQSAKLSEMKKFKKESKEESEDKGEEEDQRQPGCVLHFTNVGEGTSREDLKGLFGEHQEITWVDFKRGDTEGHIRFKNAGGAQKAIDAVKDANDGKIIIKDVESTVKVLEGEEEDKFWEGVKTAKTKVRQDRSHYRRGGGRGRGRFNRGRDRGRFGKGNRGDRDGEKDDTDKKEAPQGQHVHFDDDSSDGGKMEEDEKKPVKRPADENDDEGEPSVKQVKIDSKTDDENKTTQPPEEKADS